MEHVNPSCSGWRANKKNSDKKDTQDTKIYRAISTCHLMLLIILCKMPKSSGKSLIRLSSLHVSSKIFLILWWKEESWEENVTVGCGNMSTDHGEETLILRSTNIHFPYAYLYPQALDKNKSITWRGEAFLETHRWICKSRITDKNGWLQFIT